MNYSQECSLSLSARFANSVGYGFINLNSCYFQMLLYTEKSGKQDLRTFLRMVGE